MGEKKIERCKTTREIVDLLATLIKENKENCIYDVETFGPVGTSKRSSITILRKNQAKTMMMVKECCDGFTYFKYDNEVKSEKPMPMDNDKAVAILMSDL